MTTEQEPRTEAGRAREHREERNGVRSWWRCVPETVAIEREAEATRTALEDVAERVRGLVEAAQDVRKHHAPNEWDSCVACSKTWPCDAELLAELSADEYAALGETS